MSINKKFFTLPAEGIVDKFFGGQRFKFSENGVYFVAHADTVHKILPTDRQILVHRDIYTAPETGLGADDRCGCFITRRLIDILPKCGYLISLDEESGDHEFEKSCPDLTSTNPKIFISFDRKGVNQYVDYGHKSIAVETYLLTQGIRREHGSRSTCKELSGKYDKPCVNFCFGSDGFHSKDEYVDVSLMMRMFGLYTDFVKFALATELDYEKPKDYTGYAYGSSYYGGWNSVWDDYDDDKWDNTAKVWNSTKLAWVPKISGLKSPKGKNPHGVADFMSTAKVTHTCDNCKKDIKIGEKIWHRGKFDFCSKSCRKEYFTPSETCFLADDGKTCTIEPEHSPCIDCLNRCRRLWKPKALITTVCVPADEKPPTDCLTPAERVVVEQAKGLVTSIPAYQSNYVKCEFCGKYAPLDDIMEYQESNVCPDCFTKLSNTSSFSDEVVNEETFEVTV